MPVFSIRVALLHTFLSLCSLTCCTCRMSIICSTCQDYCKCAAVNSLRNSICTPFCVAGVVSQQQSCLLLPLQMLCWLTYSLVQQLSVAVQHQCIQKYSIYFSFCGALSHATYRGWNMMGGFAFCWACAATGPGGRIKVQQKNACQLSSQ